MNLEDTCIKLLLYAENNIATFIKNLNKSCFYPIIEGL